MDARTAEPETDLDVYADVPAEMRASPRWMLWKYEQRAGEAKPRKVPFYARGARRNGALDTPADRASLVTFDQALPAFQAGDYAGLGFALGDGWQGIDLDDLLNRPELKHLADDLPGYVEWSPSGRGVHAIGFGRTFATLNANKSGIEAYAGKRFFTVTGRSLSCAPLGCIAEYVETVLAPRHRVKPAANDSDATEDAPHPDRPGFIEMEQVVHDLRSALLHLRADDRGLWVRIGMALKSLGDVGRGLWLMWSQTSEAFDPADAARTWDSFKPDHTNWKAVFAEAQRQGWINPASKRAPPEPDAPPEGERDSGAELRVDTLAGLERAILPKRELLLAPIMPRRSLLMLYAARGVGKTYAGHGIGYAVAGGGSFLRWKAERPAKVLLIDGEMPAELLQQRIRTMRPAADRHPPSEDYFRVIAMDRQGMGVTLNLAKPEHQALIESQLDGAELLILDNISTLVAGGRENDADSWDTMQPWLLHLRRQGVSVLLIAHSGRGENARGTSKREDVLDTVIQLRRPEEYDPEDGARFEVHLTKARGVFGDDAAVFEARLETRDGADFWSATTVTDLAFERVIELTRAGKSVRDIAEDVAISKSRVNRIQAKARAEGKL
jgi:putative DNA primase/helicase